MSNDSMDSHLPLVEPTNGRTGVVPLYTRLLQLILDGTFPPGSLVSQSELAETLGVSRTPLREAIRMLQHEGMIEAELNQRLRLPVFVPQTVEVLYATRIMQEALGVQLTISHLSSHLLAAIETALQDMEAAVLQNDLPAWQIPHQQFHRLLVKHAGESLENVILGSMQRCEYYRQMLYRYQTVRVSSNPWEPSMSEHRSIFEACQRRDGAAAASRLAHHLATTAFTLLTHFSPDYDPIILETALQMVGGTQQ